MLMRMKVLRVLLLVTVILLAVSSVQATTVVLLNFDGDATFPSLTYDAKTNGLGVFDGSVVGLSPSDADAVKVNILTLLQQDYAPYDIQFITDPNLPHDKTWGLDDSYYMWKEPYDFSTPDLYFGCPMGYSCFRLYGKTSNNPGDTDKWGDSIYYPDYSRTFAGSFALPAGSAAPSSPSLDGASVAAISQALANSAGHEIGHFFGATHNGGSAGHWNIMWSESEQYESTYNKYFLESDAEILLTKLGPKQIEPSCGDTICNGDETCDSCPADCGICPPECGDGTCDSSESCGTCPADCGTCPAVPEFPSVFLPATMIIGFLGAVLLIQRTREQ
jgi:hypothetical protein